MDRINTLNYQYLEQALTRGINDVEEGRCQQRFKTDPLCFKSNGVKLTHLRA